MLRDPKLIATVMYVVRPDGTLAMDWHFNCSLLMPREPPQPGLKSSLPRVGVRFAVPGPLAQAMEWHGRGPHECYWDRKHGALLGRYTAPVESLRTEYVYPQEAGARADVRWAALHGAGAGAAGDGASPGAHAAGGDAAAGGLLMVALPRHTSSPALPTSDSMYVTVSRYSVEAVHMAGHPHDLAPEPDGAVHVHLDALHMGVGGDDSWSPSVHDEYLVPPRGYHLALALAPLGATAAADAPAAGAAAAALRCGVGRMY